MRTRRREIRNPREYVWLLQRLYTLRAQNSLTQAQVAWELGISRSQYTLIEQGRSMLNYDHLCSLAKVFRISLSELLNTK